jgi:hypothetical protein
MKPVRITSDGTSHGTKIFVNGVQLKNVKSLRLEGDAEEDDIMKLHLTLYALPGTVEIEVDGQMQVSEQPVSAGAGPEGP